MSELESGKPKRASQAHDIATLDESDWAWFGKLCIEQEWGEKERQSAIKAVKVIDIPEALHHWLDPQKWKREAALGAAKLDSSYIKNKDASRLVAMRLFPEVGNQLQLKKHYGRADALLIAEFLRRKAIASLRVKVKCPTPE